MDTNLNNENHAEAPIAQAITTWFFSHPIDNMEVEELDNLRFQCERLSNLTSGLAGELWNRAVAKVQGRAQQEDNEEIVVMKRDADGNVEVIKGI